MDPRHPELAVKRVKELIENYEDVEKKISTATVSSQLGQLEREGGLIIQELCLVAPRIHEAMMQTSRRRRHDLSSGILEKPVEKLKDDAESKKVIDESIEVVEKAKDIVEKALKDKADIIGEENIGGESGPVEKPKKKTTRKKKTTKKAED